MGALAGHHMLHAPYDLPLGNVGVGAKVHDKRSVDGQGDFGVCWYGMMLFRVHFFLAIVRTVCDESRSTGKESHRKVLGLLWDYSRTRGVRKMQEHQLPPFDPYRLDPYTGQV